MTEAEAERTPSALGSLAALIPPILKVLGILVLIAAPVMGVPGALQLWKPDLYQRLHQSMPFVEKLAMDPWDAIMLGIGGGCLLLIAYVASKVVRAEINAVRDRVTAILVLGVFVMFFWAAFEQAGNVLNVWADKNTDRYITRAAPEASVVPEVAEDEAPKTDAAGQAAPKARPQVGLLRPLSASVFKPKPKPEAEAEKSWGDSFNPVPTAWFQSINALAIFVIAPFFAWMWVWLDRRGWQPSIPMKMTLGLVLMSGRGLRWPSWTRGAPTAKTRRRLTSPTWTLASSCLPASESLESDGKLRPRPRKDEAPGKRPTSRFRPEHACIPTTADDTHTFEHARRSCPTTSRDLIIEALLAPGVVPQGTGRGTAFEKITNQGEARPGPSKRQGLDREGYGALDDQPGRLVARRRCRREDTRRQAGRQGRWNPRSRRRCR